MKYIKPTVSIKELELEGFICDSKLFESEVDQTIIFEEEEIEG